MYVCLLRSVFSTHKFAVFGPSSSLYPLVGGGGGMVCESVGTLREFPAFCVCT